MFSVGVETNVLNCKALYPCTTYYDIIKPISTNGAINQFFLGDSHGGVCNAANRPTRIEDQDYLRTQPRAPPTSPSITLTHHRNTRTNRRPAAGLWWLCVHHRHAVAPHRHGCHLGFVLRQTERSASCWASPPRCCWCWCCCCCSQRTPHQLVIRSINQSIYNPARLLSLQQRRLSGWVDSE